MEHLEVPEDENSNDDGSSNMEPLSLYEFAVAKRNSLINTYFN